MNLKKGNSDLKSLMLIKTIVTIYKNTKKINKELQSVTLTNFNSK